MTHKSHLALILAANQLQSQSGNHGRQRKQIFAGIPWDTNPQPPFFWLIYSSLVYFIITIIISMQYKT